jgi:hypothetical protein
MTFTLPSGEIATPLLRTDDSLPDRWEDLQRCLATPNADGFLAYVTLVTDPAVDGLSEGDIRRLPRDAEAEVFVLVADLRALTDADFPILVVDISGQDMPSFRVLCRCLWAVQNNLSLANMDWHEFADSTDADGVYRGC